MNKILQKTSLRKRYIFYTLEKTISTTQCFLSNETNKDSKTDEIESLTRKPATTSLEATAEYRKNQLNKITQKFQPNNTNDNESSTKSAPISSWVTEPLQIDDYNDVQPMWKDMESRVLKRRLPPKLTDVYEFQNSNSVADQNDSPALRRKKNPNIPVGRRNLRKTDEEVWLNAGLYDDPNNNTRKNGGD